MLNRTLTQNVLTGLEQMPAVALLGPRQVGKTTLAKQIGKQFDSIYLDLESPKDLIKLHDPISFLNMHRDKLIILDEIQRAPDLFMALRGLIDENRSQGKKTGQFLLLGSASMELLRQSSESLAGRIRYINMSGLHLLETNSTQADVSKLWLRGGFPESFLAASNDAAMDWLEDLIRTYLERDIPQMGFQVPGVRLRRLWTMLAHLQGETLNTTKLATNLEVQRSKITEYLDIFTDLLLLRRLEPWYANVKKRMVKSPRYYIRDTGIVHRLLDIEHYEALLSNPVLGKSWEGFVIENIHAVLPRRAKTFFYRTAAGAEIDLVIQFSSDKIWAVEIKHGIAPKLSKHFSNTCDDIGATEKFIVYGGDEMFSVGQDVTVISLAKILQKITAGSF